MMSPVHAEFTFIKGKRKYLFCADRQGADSLYALVQKAMKEKAPFDFHIIDQETDSFLDVWFNQQKMGAYLYISAQWEFVNRASKLALDAGFSDHEMQTKVSGPIRKKLICCKCHGVYDIDEDPHITCKHCGIELELSNHYSRRLDAYLGYVSIK